MQIQKLSLYTVLFFCCVFYMQGSNTECILLLSIPRTSWRWINEWCFLFRRIHLVVGLNCVRTIKYVSNCDISWKWTKHGINLGVNITYFV